MKNQTETNVNEKIGGGVNFYRNQIFSIVENVYDESTLKKIYTFAKTLKDILNEKEGG